MCVRHLRNHGIHRPWWTTSSIGGGPLLAMGEIIRGRSSWNGTGP